MIQSTSKEKSGARPAPLRPQSEVDRGRATVARSAAPSVARGWRKLIYLGSAGFCFILGLLGAVLPGLPATPFLLLTSYCLVRSSPRLNAALLRSKWFGPILRDWQVHGGVRRHVKAKAILVVVLAVGLTVGLSGLTLWMKAGVILLAGIGVGVIAKLPIAEGTGHEEFTQPTVVPKAAHRSGSSRT